MGTYPHGLFSWADVSTTDPKAGAAFYGALFGWEGEDQFAPDGTYVYTMFSRDGAAAAGLGGLPQEMQEAGVPPSWNSYVTVEDVDAVVAKVTEHGGSVVVPAMDVFTSGRMAFVADPGGAVVGLWQEGDHPGAAAFNRPGFLTWNELVTRDSAGARSFWEQVLGWTFEEMPEGTPSEYWIITMPDKPQGDPLAEDAYNGGIMTMDENWPPDMPSHWAVYFHVADADATATQVEELGGSIVMAPFSAGVGRIAVLRDPQGAVFQVISPPASD